ncbi:hypothetical protein PCANC_13369 [Puccinia coronata f. sp. avenae]|uniref:Uncharacterized protein n=1 Tax=Puccinia coronata f. sp. avenae TaxID=200324 RepID=A0A2N5S4L0_9BASI|nr:hypothetical protein PCANC_23563 [Puccinia coronata f. sp. avenae]PLW53343.1 hypothetical protein PCANC_13369 [Puccinia coronata f. sp. avenae]
MLNTRSPRTKKDQPKEKASPSRLSSRSSPSRLNKLSGKTAPLLPAQIPLPPSPPASDALVLDDPFAPPSSPPPQQQQHQHQVQRRVSPRTKASASRQPVPQPTRRRSTHRALEAAIESKQLLSRARTKKRRVLEDQFQSSSPPTSPTNRKSSRTTKRLKTYSSPARRSPSSSPTRAAKDSPNNPFLAHPGEKPRRAGAKRDDEYRKLVYVFRGKRIPYDTAEDLNEGGGSPFASSCPKLLFPSPPSPGAPRKLQFREEEDTIVGGSRGACQLSPSRANQRDRSHLAFQTPKRDKDKNQSHMLPTPQSRPRRTTQQPNPHSNPNPLTAGPAKSAKTMAKAMR